MNKLSLLLAASGLFCLGLASLAHELRKEPPQETRPTMHNYDDMEWDFPDEKNRYY